jgi:hypothetical protein
MKKTLSILLSAVLINATVAPVALAKHGGPDIGSFGGGVSVIGTYSGVLIPVNEAGLNIGSGFNSIGIFTLAAPVAGATTGGFSFFGNGQVYQGSITAIADPDKKTLDGVLDAATTLLAPNGNTYIGQALGSIKADIVAQSSTSAFNAGSSARITGTAHVDVFEGNFNDDLSVAVASTFDFIVDGFKQTDTVTNVALPTPTSPTSPNTPTPAATPTPVPGGGGGQQIPIIIIGG